DGFRVSLHDDLRRHEWVIGEDVYFEPEAQSGEDAANGAEANYADAFARELCPDELGWLPLACAHRTIGLRKMAAQGKEMRESKFGGRRCIGVGRVQNHDPALSSGGHVDIVNPNAGAADDLQLLAGGDYRRGHARLRAHDDSVVSGYALNQLRFA